MRAHWNYSPCERDTTIEIGKLEVSSAISLATHFHWDVQAVAVAHGWRSYSTPLGTLMATPGHIVIIPALVPHASWGSPTALVTHVYVPPAHPAVRGILAPAVLRCSHTSVPGEILDTIGSLHHACGPDDPRVAWFAPKSLVPDRGQDVGSIAAQLGYSTDGFIRAFRRQFGMTPAAYRLAYRLARARSLLKSGEPVAGAAYAASFADQSHLGRLFRRAYGTTPAAYRSAFAAA